MIRLDDSKPWFQRWMWIGYRPITDEGRLLMSVSSGIILMAGVVALLTGGASPWTEIAFGITIPVVIATNAIAFFKMGDGF